MMIDHFAFIQEVLQRDVLLNILVVTLFLVVEYKAVQQLGVLFQ